MMLVVPINEARKYYTYGLGIPIKATSFVPIHVAKFDFESQTFQFWLWIWMWNI